MTNIDRVYTEVEEGLLLTHADLPSMHGIPLATSNTNQTPGEFRHLSTAPSLSKANPYWA